MLTQLVLMKLVDAVAAQVAAQAAAEAQAAPRRIAFNAAGKNFIDAYVDAYIAAAPAARRLIIDGILVRWWLPPDTRRSWPRGTGRRTRSRGASPT